MPGYLLTSSSTVTCAHQGQGQTSTPLTKVKVDGNSAIGQSSSYTISACTFLPTAGGPPCATAQWTVAATRVKSNGVAVVLEDSTSTCVPTGTPLTVVVGQNKVKGT